MVGLKVFYRHAQVSRFRVLFFVAVRGPYWVMKGLQQCSVSDARVGLKVL